jgi:DNA-binding CsgD family transcriptional regulator
MDKVSENLEDKVPAKTAAQILELQHLKKQSQAFDRMNAIVLTVSGEVEIMSTTAADLLDRYFDGEWLNTVGGASLQENCLPAVLDNWVQQQLRLHQAEIVDYSQPQQIEKNGRKLKIDLLCNFTAAQHLLICAEKSIVDPTGSANKFSPRLHFQSIGLSKREAEVLALVAAGKTNLEISERLSISIKTVKKHLEHIFSKLNANSRNDAVNKALVKLDRSLP